ncbi:MAG: AmmeMemoRadiSam system radical SAM enzyme [Oscillospiraceae bacterium]|nr:AmmeMemoRadiSam system radical SAM enzyme [Oscillospiraceae bacterium]
MNEAQFYEKSDGNSVFCALCPHNCKIKENGAGICGIRKNFVGILYAAGYGRISSFALDPIEKKPLYMFHPGKKVLSLGGFGCNLRCPFCQNFEISVEYGKRQKYAEKTSPEKIASLAKKYAPYGNIGAAYTYNEPLVGYEFVHDCAKAVHEAGLCNVLVTNGYINRGPLEKLLPHIDAANIDLKSFTDGFYHSLGGSLGAVKETIETVRKSCHVEITTLVIPGENDSESEIEALSMWLASLDDKIPLHLTRFFPRYKYTGKAPPSKNELYRLCEIAKKHLRHVFAGNV